MRTSIFSGGAERAIAMGLTAGALLVFTTAGCPILVPSPGFAGIRGSDFPRDFNGFDTPGDVVRGPDTSPNPNANFGIGGIPGRNVNLNSGTDPGVGNPGNGNFASGNTNLNFNVGIGGGNEGNFNSGTGIGGGNEGNFNSDTGIGGTDGNANSGVNPFNGNAGG
jgi:hypothetical protein